MKNAATIEVGNRLFDKTCFYLSHCPGGRGQDKLRPDWGGDNSGDQILTMVIISTKTSYHCYHCVHILTIISYQCYHVDHPGGERALSLPFHAGVEGLGALVWSSPWEPVEVANLNYALNLWEVKNQSNYSLNRKYLQSQVKWLILLACPRTERCWARCGEADCLPSSTWLSKMELQNLAVSCCLECPISPL